MPHFASTLASATNWGDVPTWVSACATLMAFLFAAGAVLIARRTYRLESERDRINASERRKQEAFLRRSQAALVSAWWAEDGQNGQGKHSWAGHLRNASDTPVYKASLTIIGPGSRPRRKVLDLQVVPPAQVPAKYHFNDLGLQEDGRHDQDGHPLADYRVSLRFTDATGIRWMRDEYGNLKELDSNLLIWTSPEGGAVVTPFTADFLATYGVTAKCDTALIEAELERHFIDTDPGPDILIGPHDWVGDLAKLKLLEPIVLSQERSDFFAPEHLTAFMFGGELFAVPSSLDTVALIRNTDLVPDVPASIEELLEIAQDLRSRQLVTELMTVPVGRTGDPFHMWPLFTSAGGWLFERSKDGAWNPARHGIGSSETLKALEKIRVLGDLGVLQPAVDRIRSFELFIKRQTPFLVAASGAVVPIRNAGVNFAVSAVPPFENCPAGTPFLSVNGFYIARRGQNKAVAGDLVPDYLTRSDVTEAFGRLGHVVPLQMTDECDPAIRDFHAVCGGAIPMPTFPQMRDVWTYVAAAEMRLIAGDDATVVATNLAQQLQRLF
jgi:arabinogalactan oligomer/maltooligosaccharide transport system substrate-binding protein